jgi:hypothetical protein
MVLTLGSTLIRHTLFAWRVLSEQEWVLGYAVHPEERYTASGTRSLRERKRERTSACVFAKLFSVQFTN